MSRRWRPRIPILRSIFSPPIPSQNYYILLISKMHKEKKLTTFHVSKLSTRQSSSNKHLPKQRGIFMCAAAICCSLIVSMYFYYVLLATANLFEFSCSFSCCFLGILFGKREKLIKFLFCGWIETWLVFIARNGNYTADIIILRMIQAAVYNNRRWWQDRHVPLMKVLDSLTFWGFNFPCSKFLLNAIFTATHPHTSLLDYYS